MASPHGDFIWYEMLTDDAAQAAAFYTAVVGWKAVDAGMPNVDYTIFNAGEVGIGGLMKIPPDACAAGASPGWIGHVWVGDIDATVAQVADANGAVQRPPTEIPGIGRYAVVTDPQGAAIMLLHAEGQGRKPAPPGTPGYPAWCELRAADGATAFGFYETLFGWTKADTMDMGGAGPYQMFRTNAELAGGMMTKGAEMPAPTWLYYFFVDDIDAAAARVKANGGSVLHGPHQVPGGIWMIQSLDPEGALFGLVGPKSA